MLRFCALALCCLCLALLVMPDYSDAGLFGFRRQNNVNVQVINGAPVAPGAAFVGAGGYGRGNAAFIGAGGYGPGVGAPVGPCGPGAGARFVRTPSGRLVRVR